MKEDRSETLAKVVAGILLAGLSGYVATTFDLHWTVGVLGFLLYNKSILKRHNQ